MAVTLGETGALTGSTDTAVKFGATDQLRIPNDIVSAVGDRTFEVWVKPPVGAAGGLTADTYAHIVVTYDHSAAIGKFYRNGVLEETAAGSVVIGSGEAFTGTLDELAIYSEVLSAERIAAHFAAGPAGTPTFYKAQLLQIGAIIRGIPALPGNYRASDIGIAVRNTSQEFSKLKATDSFFNIDVRVKRAITDDVASTTVGQGKVDDQWTINNERLTIRARDTVFERLRDTIDTTAKVLDTATFPDLPNTQKPLLVPIIYGDNQMTTAAINAGDGPATCPCYLIDPAVGQSKYRYVVAQHAVSSVVRVFAYESLVASSGYTVGTATFGGVVMTVIDFDADQRTAARARDLEVTADVKGKKDSDGNLQENPVEQMRDFLTTYGPTIDSSDIGAEVDTASVDSDTRLYKGAFCLLDREWTYTDVLGEFTKSFQMPIWATRAGLIAAAIVTEDIQSTTANVTETMDILAGTFRVLGNPEHASRIRYDYRFNWTRAFYDRQQSIFILGEETKLGREVIRDLKLSFVRDATTAVEVARAHGAFLKETTAFAEFEVAPRRLADVDINTWLALTHKEGIGASGYVDQSVRVLQSDYYPQLTEARVGLKVVVIPTTEFITTAYQQSSLWAIAPTELAAMIAEVTGTTGHESSPYAWGLTVGGDEYRGGISSVGRGIHG